MMVNRPSRWDDQRIVSRRAYGGRAVVTILVIALLGVSIGCARHTWFTSDRRFLVEGLEKGLPPLPSDLAGIGIDYDAVYVRHEPGREQRRLAYIRFWPNGRYIDRYVDITTHGLDASIADDFTYGRVGRWSVESPGILVLQQLVFGEPNTGSFVKRRVQLVDGGRKLYAFEIVFEGAWGVDTRDSTFYLHHPVPGMARQPDW